MFFFWTHCSIDPPLFHTGRCRVCVTANCVKESDADATANRPNDDKKIAHGFPREMSRRRWTSVTSRRLCICRVCERIWRRRLALAACWDCSAELYCRHRHRWREADRRPRPDRQTDTQTDRKWQDGDYSMSQRRSPGGAASPSITQ